MVLIILDYQSVLGKAEGVQKILHLELRHFPLGGHSLNAGEDVIHLLRPFSSHLVHLNKRFKFCANISDL